MIVDKSKPGYGNSNYGNTTKRFFENTDVSSSITGVDTEIFGTDLKTMASEYNMNLELFNEYIIL